jgi:hypothetical protein
VEFGRRFKAMPVRGMECSLPFFVRVGGRVRRLSLMYSFRIAAHSLLPFRSVLKV